MKARWANVDLLGREKSMSSPSRREEAAVIESKKEEKKKITSQIQAEFESREKATQRMN